MAEQIIHSLISTLNNKLKTTRAPLDSGDSGITKDGYVIHDLASGTVRVYGIANSSNNIAVSNIIAYVPAAFRPSQNFAGVCMIYTETGITTIGACLIHPDGSISQESTNFARSILFVAEYSI